MISGEKSHGIAADVARPGASLSEILAASLAAGNHPGETVTEIEARYRKRLAGTRRRVVTVEHVIGNGRTIRIVYTALGDGVWLAVHEDISELKGYLAALSEREDELLLNNMRFQYAINNMPQGLCMFDGDKRLVVWNRRYAEIYQVPHTALQRGDLLETGAAPASQGG